MNKAQLAYQNAQEFQTKNYSKQVNYILNQIDILSRRGCVRYSHIFTPCVPKQLYDSLVIMLETEGFEVEPQNYDFSGYYDSISINWKNNGKPRVTVEELERTPPFA